MTTVNTKMYGNFIKNALTSTVNLLNDDIKVMLCTSAYIPNQDNHIYKDISVTNEVSGTGYTAGGNSLTSKSLTYYGSTTAASWAVSTSYIIGTIVRPAAANGHVYQCISAGTSGASSPAFSTTSGATVTDGTVTWREVGMGYTTFNSASVVWSNFSTTARYAVIYDNTPVGNKPLIAYLDFSTDQSSNNGNFTITWDTNGIFNVMSS